MSKKMFFLLIVIIALLFCSCEQETFSYNTYFYGAYEYSVSGSEITLTQIRYYNLTEHAEIPETIYGLPVIKINLSNNYNNTNIRKITLPETLREIEGTISGLSSLREITIRATTPPSLNWNAFYGASLFLRIYVPSESLYNYKQAYGWQQYEDKIYALY